MSETPNDRIFPIMGGPSIPWRLIAPHERQAQRNHQQTLERLAERGGLSPFEVMAVLEDRDSGFNPIGDERERLAKFLNADAYKLGFRDGQASCAPWMQHKAGCAVLTAHCAIPVVNGEFQCVGMRSRTDAEVAAVKCTCGLLAHLTPTGGETPADPRDRQALITFSRSDYEQSTKSDV